TGAGDGAYQSRARAQEHPTIGEECGSAELALGRCEVKLDTPVFPVADDELAGLEGREQVSGGLDVPDLHRLEIEFELSRRDHHRGEIRGASKEHPVAVEPDGLDVGDARGGLPLR